MKKYILMSIIGLLAVIALTLGVFILVRTLGQPKAVVSNTGVETSATPDRSANYGACDLVSVAQIKDALGESAASLAKGFDTGKGNTGNGDTAQNCVYGLHTAVNKISGTMLQDTFYITVYAYADTTNQSIAKDAYKNAVTVDGLGDYAGFFTATNETTATTEYRLQVNVGLRAFSFAIRQPTASKTFDQSTALNALRQLAKKVPFNDFKDKK